MKKLLASLAIVLSVVSFANAQKIAFKGGFTYSDAIMSPEPVDIIDGKAGFHAGIVLQDLMLSDKIGIQPELIYSQQGFKIGGVGSIGMHYLSLPILLKFPVTEELSLLAGPQVSYLTNTKIGIGNGLFSVNYNGLFKDIDLGLVGGLEYKVSDKVALGGRYVLGLTNVNKDFQIDNNNNLSDYLSIKNTSAQVYVSFSFGKN